MRAYFRLVGCSESGVFLRFATIDDGEAAWVQLRDELTTLDDVTVEHPKFQSHFGTEKFWETHPFKHNGKRFVALIFHMHT